MSVLEHARAAATPGDGARLAAGLVEAMRVLTKAPGCLRVELARGIERPDTFVVVVEWQSVQHHLDFRESAMFADYRAPMKDLLAAPPLFEHYEQLEITGG